MDDLLRVATQALTYVNTLHTDEPCMIWGSPWDHRTSDPVDFVLMIAAFSLETDERSIVLSNIEEEHDRAELLRYLSMTIQWAADRGLRMDSKTLVETVCGRDLEDDDGEAALLLSAVEDLLIAA